MAAAAETTTGTAPPSGNMEEYYRESAARCFLNNSCNFCTCRCCGFCIAICWVIFGAIGAYTSSASISFFETYDSCPSGSFLSGECCGISTAGTTSEAYITGSCDPYVTAYTLDLVNGILQCIAGVCGVVGLGMFISWLLWVPIGYAVVSVILMIVAVIMLLSYFGAAVFVSPVFGIGISVCLMILFYTNLKLVKFLTLLLFGEAVSFVIQMYAHGQFIRLYIYRLKTF